MLTVIYDLVELTVNGKFVVEPLNMWLNVFWLNYRISFCFPDVLDRNQNERVPTIKVFWFFCIKPL